MSKRVMAIDPGKTTGLAMLDMETGDYTYAEWEFTDTASFILAHAQEHGADLVIVVERFFININTIKDTQAPWSLEVIGWARGCSHLFCNRDVHLHDAAAAKRFGSDERLKTMGWYVPGRGHANDAARHLLLLLVTRGWLDNKVLRSLTT